MRERTPTARKARGQALIVLLLMVSIAAMLLVYGSSSEVARIVKSEQKTRATLEYAREALIGRAIGDANRPGSMPCPDADGDGSADLFAGSSCPSYIGRLPWRTLGIGDLRDESGERLWYALSPGFRDHPAAPPLNSDTRGALTVYSSSGTIAISREAVAVIFAAGPALPAQLRDEATTQCVTTGRHVPRTRCATNYLDTAAGFSNAGAAGPFIASTPAPTYNDRLALIVTADFMPQVEQRVALELRQALFAYRTMSTCRCYPWADTSADGVSDAGRNRGRIPVSEALPEPWRAGALPSYFSANDWARVIYYTVARDALENTGKDCTTCSDTTLSLDGASGYELLLVTPGPSEPGALRAGWADYLHDPENRNEDDRYVTPVSARSSRNRLYAVTTPYAGCSANAGVLLHNLPCASPDAAVRAVCESAGAALEGCTCATAARTVLKPPCATRVHGSGCEAAIRQLQACTS